MEQQVTWMNCLVFWDSIQICLVKTWCTARELAERYSADVADNLDSELDHLKIIHAANREMWPCHLLTQFNLLNSLCTLKIDNTVSKHHHNPANLLHTASYCGSSITFFQYSDKSLKSAEVNNVSRSVKQLGNFRGSFRENSWYWQFDSNYLPVIKHKKLVVFNPHISYYK